MGGSSSTRKITIVNDEAEGVIKISDSVVKRLKGETHEREAPRRTVNESVNTPYSLPEQPRARFDSEQGSTSGQFFRHGTTPYEEMRLQAMHLNKEKEEELRKIDAHWRNKLEAAEKQNVEIEKRMAADFTTAVTEVGKLLPYQNCEPVCTDREKLVLDCYQANKKTSLNCSKEVRDFSNCVQQARLNNLIKG